MKKIVLLFALLNSTLFHGQQNFINVPSAEVTTKRKLFFQQQINCNELIQSNSTLDYSLGKGFETGINLLGLNFSDKNKSFLNTDTNDRDPYNPLVLLNGLKQMELSKRISLAAGTQFGINFTDHKKRTNASLTYVNFRLTDWLMKNSCFVLGSYCNSRHYGGTGNRVGIWAGSEIALKPNIHVMAESIIGSNALCYTSLGIIYYPIKKMPLTLGIQIPNTKHNAYSIVFELTIIPYHKL